eukprot:5806964-Amphidinium_carterae.1
MGETTSGLVEQLSSSFNPEVDGFLSLAGIQDAEPPAGAVPTALIYNADVVSLRVALPTQADKGTGVYELSVPFVRSDTGASRVEVAACSCLAMLTATLLVNTPQNINMRFWRGKLNAQDSASLKSLVAEEVKASELVTESSLEEAKLVASHASVLKLLQKLNLRKAAPDILAPSVYQGFL